MLKLGRNRRQGQYFAKKGADGICAQTGANVVPVSLRSTQVLKHLLNL